MKTMKTLYYSFVLSCLLLCFAGCSGNRNPEGRLDVSGTITLNGGPFTGASVTYIVFDPIDDPSLGSTMAPFDVNTGKYLCTMQSALKPGKYKVRIFAQGFYDKRTNKPVPPNFEEDGQGYYVPLIPPEFNNDSTLELVVSPDKENVFDYDVKAEITSP